jgi:phosphoglycolate phosphatase
VAGADYEETRVEKADVIRYALGSANAASGARAVMVGDRSTTSIGAKKCGFDRRVIDGYGSLEELRQPVRRALRW